ncbi:nitrate transporter [Rhodobacter xanthinilyticus]|uniref:Nitrate transporter n=1 Tax=Rhodobacter xanthinilyticus TaxID=1850250 RepID=A0A1D9M7T5_9RHOB|nr:ABC transporter substrate-binding protein [Rhodobacter xanthinilyticus]AOZ67907.1 nitrate transporter [Rhodobacter xanthinilyticus]
MSVLPVRMGYLPLVDAAPLFIAKALGFAEQEGLDLALHPAPSWSALRDMLALGMVDGAQMLAPVPVALALGLGGARVEFDALQLLNANGDVIGVSPRLAAKMRGAGFGFDFRDPYAAGRALLAAAGGRLRIGVPFPFSMHMELVQYWLENLGQKLPAEFSIHTVPPAMMAQAMEADEIDAFAVGEPWGSYAVERGVGELLLPGTAIWAFSPEKVLAVRRGWADENPDLAGRMMRAVWRACRWLGDPGNRFLVSDILSGPDRLPIAPEIIDRALSGRMLISPSGEERAVPGLIEFYSGAATFPWRSQAAWIGTRLAARHGLDPAEAAKKAAAVFRADLYRLHLRGAGADLPGASEKLEGALAAPTAVSSERGRMILPVDQFFDCRVFDPAAPVG